MLLLPDAAAQRSFFGKSSSGINHIQACVSTFFLTKNQRVVVCSPGIFSCPVKESDRVGIDKQEGGEGNISFGTMEEKIWRFMLRIWSEDYKKNRGRQREMLHPCALF